ncbi:ScbR family autoregulator-binding transcription factor [Streptomyces sp. NPDC057403]|uniref:ScbR family autoregulator-binding transcription factor n=1 Tax=Streptomyces sp. NPDC057403 TaxID=3346119 RepID=UPI0036C45FD5
MQERSEKTRHRLVHAGAQMFDLKGYANATLSDIADAAGVSKGALYFHFSSKEDLAEVVRHRGQSLVSQALRSVADSRRTPLQALVDLTHWLAWALVEDPALRAAFRITGERAVDDQPAATGLHRMCIAAGRHLLRRARCAGELRRPAAEEGAQMLVDAALCGIEVLARAGMTYDELSGRINALWDLMLPVLVPCGTQTRYRTAAPATHPVTGGCGVREPAAGGRQDQRSSAGLTPSE